MALVESPLNKSHSSALNKCLCRPRKDLVESARIKALASNQSSCPFSMAMKPLVLWRYGHESSCFCSNKVFFSRYGHRSPCSYSNMLSSSPCSNMPTEALVLLMSFDVCASIRQHTPAYISIRRPLVVGLRRLVARVLVFSSFVFHLRKPTFILICCLYRWACICNVCLPLPLCSLLSLSVYMYI